jgi:hypothetical protein
LTSIFTNGTRENPSSSALNEVKAISPDTNAALAWHVANNKILAAKHLSINPPK